jgi:hypothetical protein
VALAVDGWRTELGAAMAAERNEIEEG